MGGKLVIEARRGQAGALAAFWVGEALLGLLFALLGVLAMDEEPWWFRTLFVMAGILLLAAGILMTGLMRKTLLLKGPAIEMDARGFIDHRISPQKIPWDSMRWGIVKGFRHGGSVCFDLTEDFRRIYAPCLAMRLQARVNEGLSYPPFVVQTLGTGKSAEDLVAHMERFSRPESRSFPLK